MEIAVKKQQRATDRLNVALSKIATAATVMMSLADQLIDSEDKPPVESLSRRIEEGVSEAYAEIAAIRQALEKI